MVTLTEIDGLARDFAVSRKTLQDRMQELEDELSQVKKRHLGGIRKAVTIAATYQSRLRAAIEDSPELFVKPRSLVLYGIKVGFQKGKGELKWEDTEQVVKLIHKHFPEQAETLIKLTETPVKTALAQLSVQDLKRIGVAVTETGDQILLKPTDSDVDKLVDALLRDELQEARDAA
jgi:DNA-binding transcriptional MocR family regulator